jgi:hypothetical protein
VLLVTTSLRLLALHAWSGALLWDSGEPAGWDTLTEKNRALFLAGVDRMSGIVAPAAGGHVALAALQIPVTFVQNYVYAGNIPVTTIIPDRRLFAYDLESGRPLWSHEPPAAWDGESGSFAQRMSVAGPPILCGTRVLAPYYRMQGRIDYHVACFDLETGALLWSTALISGQRELNMFGRAEHEFTAPPLVVHDDRVIALTQLGTIAALDLFTGEILWETLYDQVPLPKSLHGGFRAANRDVKWRSAPPVVAEGVVVATPLDSESMVGLDLETGGLLWSLDHRRVEVLLDRADIDLLVGARPGTVFVAGSVLGAIAARSGLRISAPSAARWKFSDDDLRDNRSWRPVLAGDRIVLPLSQSRVEVDVETGRSVSREPWEPPGSGGNLIVGAGELSTVSSAGVTGWFDWDLLTQRAREAVAARPDDPALALALGRLLADRGGAEWQRGRIEEARTNLAEAESVLGRALAAEAQPGAEASPARAEMHRVLRAQARLRAGLADRTGALAALRRARPLAPDKATLRDTILEEIALLRGPEPETAAARAEATATLESECSDLPIVCDAVRDAGEVSGRAEPPRFVPIVGNTVRSDAVYCEMPVGLWTILDRVADAAAIRDSRAEFVGLHAVLERYPDVELPDGPASALAAERIGALLREGRTDGYDGFEASARKLLESALAAGDRVELARIGRLYPHSRAAQEADDHRLTAAYESGDAAEVARIVQAQIPLAGPGGRGFSLAGRDGGPGALAAPPLGHLREGREPRAGGRAPAPAGRDARRDALRPRRRREPDAGGGRGRPAAARRAGSLARHRPLRRALPRGGSRRGRLGDPRAAALLRGRAPRDRGLRRRARADAPADGPRPEPGARDRDRRAPRRRGRPRPGFPRGAGVGPEPHEGLGRLGAPHGAGGRPDPPVHERRRRRRRRPRRARLGVEDGRHRLGPDLDRLRFRRRRRHGRPRQRAPLPPGARRALRDRDLAHPAPRSGPRADAALLVPRGRAAAGADPQGRADPRPLHRPRDGRVLLRDAGPGHRAGGRLDRR